MQLIGPFHFHNGGTISKININWEKFESKYVLFLPFESLLSIDTIDSRVAMSIQTLTPLILPHLLGVNFLSLFLTQAIIALGYHNKAITTAFMETKLRQAGSAPASKGRAISCFTAQTS
jgi:hypothetical protein